MEHPGATWHDSFVVEHVAETGSTNADLLARAEAGAPHWTVRYADHQTAGRGRLGRVWEAPPGANLLVSILWRRDLHPLHALTQRVSLAAVHAAERVARVRPVIKWPNDLLLDGRKLAGILAQAGGRGAIDYVVVGLGLNVGWAPAGAARLPAGTRDEVLAAVLEHLAACPADVSAAYRERLATLGSSVRVDTPSGAIVGHAVDLDQDGSLVVELADGSRRAIGVGDVTHLRPV